MIFRNIKNIFKKNDETKFNTVENSTINNDEIIKIKGDGKPYIDFTNEKYNNMTKEEKNEVYEIGRMLNKKFGIDNQLIRSSIYGFIIGDALGVPVEFLNRETLKSNPIKDMEEYGTHNQPKGTWSDDTSMVLATIDGLLNSESNNIDYKKIITNFFNWKQKGEFTPFGKVFDIGNATSSALYTYQQNIIANDENNIMCGSGDINSNGNGSLMRILPISLYLYYSGIDYDSPLFFETIKVISSMTHSHIYSILGCYIYTIYLIELIKENDKFVAYKNMQDILKEACDKNVELLDIKNVYGRIVYNDISKLNENDIISTGYVVYSLESAIWCILTTNSFEEAVLKAVNLGDDTDTIAALTGGLAGIIYYENIPQKWIDCLQNKEYLDKIINNFVEYINNLTSVTYEKKYDSDLFNYYFEQTEEGLSLIKYDNGNESKLKTETNDTSKAALALSCFGYHDVTAFAAYIEIPLVFLDKKTNKEYHFLSLEAYNNSFSYMVDDKTKQQINIDINNFYCNKELQLKFNFVILHPICFEVDRDNLDISYKNLVTINNDLINNFIKEGIYSDADPLYSLLEDIKVLKKFIDIQNENYEIALKEIKNGKKVNHWMWYIFPQIRGLGHSEMSNYYAINDLKEAKMYLYNEVLRNRLLLLLDELLKLDINNPEKIFGKTDSLKLKSSLTLFYLADPSIEQFKLVIEKFFGGNFDGRTVDIINMNNN